MGATCLLLNATSENSSCRSEITRTGCVYIYGLADPSDGLIYYVGKSKNPRRRLSDHLRNARLGGSRPVLEWIRNLLDVEAMPQLVILDKVSEFSWNYHERVWIERCGFANPELKNVTRGGEGIDSATASKLNAGRKLSDASRRKISDSLKRHYANSGESAKAGLGTYKRNANHVRRIREATGKLTQEQVEEIKALYEEGVFQREIANRYGVSQTCISKIVNGKIWSKKL